MDKNTEYSALKSEILNLDSERNNLIIAMYTIFVTVFCFSVQFKNQYAFLSVYIVLFAFQRRFISIREGMNRIAAYIAVYLDSPTGWEANFITIFKETCVKNKQIVKMPKVIELITGRLATVQLGFICSAGTLIMVISDYIKRVLEAKGAVIFFVIVKNIRVTDVLVIIVAIVFYISLWVWATNTKTISQRTLYIKSLRRYEINRRENLDNGAYNKEDN
ncbi:MAG: hypothetical protein K6E98_04180 [Lachnospiraceae bacterium]|nr:hypothetical protein [Lachnospiraceae bacterium]